MTSSRSKADDRSVLNQLAQEARVLRRARMLPDGPLTPQHAEQVRRDFKAYTRENGITLERVSRTLGKGFSASTLSMFLAGKYHGDVDKVARAVNDYIEREAQAVPPPKGFVEVEIARRMMTVIRTAVRAKGMGLITGPAGVGKTITAQAATAMITGSIYHRVSVSGCRHRALWLAIGQQLGAAKRGSIGEIYNALVSHLEGTNRPIIIDEAHKMRPDALEALRDLHDEAGVPVILIGTHGIRDRVDDKLIQFGQFSSRLVARVDVNDFIATGGTRGTSRHLYTIDEVQQALTVDNLRITDDGWQMLWQLACSPGLGSLRLAQKVVDIAQQLNRREISGRKIRAIVREMHGDAWIEVFETRVGRQNLQLAEAG